MLLLIPKPEFFWHLVGEYTTKPQFGCWFHGDSGRGTITERSFRAFLLLYFPLSNNHGVFQIALEDGFRGQGDKMGLGAKVTIFHHDSGRESNPLFFERVRCYIGYEPPSPSPWSTAFWSFPSLSQLHNWEFPSVNVNRTWFCHQIQ